MTHRTLFSVMILTLLLAGLGPLRADDRSRLYTRPDPEASGGIRGKVISPGLPIEQILATPPSEPGELYKGSITDPNGREFFFEGLPMRKYDLVIIYRDRFYEGLDLHRGASTLTDEDLEKIDQTLQKSEPFFNHKIIHRVEGETGRGNMARAIVTYLAAKDLFLQDKRTPHKRTFKLVILKDVGPGWQIVKTRDFYPKSVPVSEGRPAHTHVEALSGIRVTNYIKDLGELNISVPNP